MTARKGAALIVAGTHSGAGKTTVACAVLAALRKRGLAVQPFKVGPDYLDPGYHALAAGRPSINLDLWMMPREAVHASFAARTADADIAVVEGMMGLYDGLGLDAAAVSTADLAVELGLPVVLVVDAGAMAESAAAVVHGFATYGRASVAGVVFNRAAGERHFAVLKRAVEAHGKTRVFGWLPSDANLEIPERHLGLVSADAHRTGELFPRLVERVERTVDLDALLAAARPPSADAPAARHAKPKEMRAKIAVARDAAFHFYYEDNLEALRAAGAEIVPFSPLAHGELPAGVGGLYLGGGFPEVHASKLEANRPMRESIRAAIERGVPTYAECGGLMYLSSHLVGSGVRAWEMVGALPGEVRMDRTPRHFGYVTATAERPSFLVRHGEALRGHEFHFSIWTREGGDESVYRVSRPGREETRREGFASGSVHASYVHLHFASAPQLPERFVAAAAKVARPTQRRRRKES